MTLASPGDGQKTVYFQYRDIDAVSVFITDFLRENYPLTP